MKIPASLGGMVDVVNEVLFFQRSLTRSAMADAVKRIAGRQGLPGSYAGMFAPTKEDFRDGVTVFTGEHIGTRAGTAHILSEEACRVLILLDIPAGRKALARATVNMMARLEDTERRGYQTGTYCCGICSCAYWRHLSVGGLSRQEERLAAGMRVLKSRRLDNGRWRVFPFWYTLLALTEIDVDGAKAEKQFAARICERYLRRSPAGEFADRRRRVAEIVMGQV